MTDIPSLEEIFNKYKSRIYWLAVGITKNQDDAQDVLQNTLLKVTKNIQNFRGESKVSTWIYKIAYNEALMHLRTRSRQFRLSRHLSAEIKNIPGGLFINWPQLPDEQLINKELKQRIDNAVRSMPIKYRTALLLHNFEGLSVKDTAAVLNIKENSLKNQLHYAHLFIKSEITDYYKDKKSKERTEDAQCSRLVKFIYDYARGQLHLEQKSAFDRHIKSCDPCKSFLDSYSQAIRITGVLQCQDLPPPLHAKIAEFLAKNP